MNYRNLHRYVFFFFATLLLFVAQSAIAQKQAGIVVIQTDFGLKDGAVSEMKGVMYGVNQSLIISDLTHKITPFNIWEAAYWLYQVAPYWPKGTVFVSVVDPGVGTKRLSVVALSNNGYFFVTPDNGTLTLIDDYFGIKEVRQIDESKNRLPGSTGSYTFHGRDVYGYTAAKLAANQIEFKDVGPRIQTPIVKINYQKAYIKNNKLYGTVVVLDPQYGNLWTNINADLVKQFQMKKGMLYRVSIFYQNEKKYHGVMPYQSTFGDVPIGKPLLYLNSLMNLSVGGNQINFSKKMHVSAGLQWRIEIVPLTVLRDGALRAPPQDERVGRKYRSS